MSDKGPEHATGAGETQLLIVEDNDSLRRALKRWLRAALPDCRIVAVESGEQGLAAARAQHPRIVLTDVRLPGINGLETARRIKSDLPETQVVIFTHCDADAYRDTAMEAGASAYVLKQRAKHELLPLLRRLLTAAPRTEIRGCPAETAAGREDKQAQENE